MERPHTIHATEQRLRPLTAGCCVAATLVDMTLLASAWPPLGWLQWACAICCAALVGMLARRTAKRRVSIGMIPVAVFSLGFAGLYSARWPLTAFGLGVLGFFAWCFVVLRGAYATAPGIRDGAAIIVLGCSVRGGVPGATLERRLQVALDAWRNHNDITIVATGGDASEDGVSEAEVMQVWLLARGVDSQRVIVEDQAANTEQNLAFSSRLLDQAGHTGQRCVVSSDYHLWRVMRIAREQGLTVVPLPARTPLAGRLVQWCREVLVDVNWLRQGR